MTKATNQSAESCHCQLLLTTVCCNRHGNIYCSKQHDQFLTLPAYKYYAVQGLCNSQVAVCPSVRLSCRSISATCNRLQQQLCCSQGVGAVRYWSISAGARLPSVLWCCCLGGRKGIRPVKNWVLECWHGYLYEASCRLAYGPADATATHSLLLQ